ncbi:MAG: motility associated factor glycosyltransferase family protein, partial [Thermotogaceae bacterium]|nr:motility associated factor glycosyltransferase family protein [Thermotogaceae bacterium]
MKITVERNQDNFANIVLNVDGKTLRMYPERNIKQRVAKEVATWLKKDDARLHILIGVGLGYHLESFFNSTKGRSEYLLIEPIEEIASIADLVVNLRSVEKLPNVTYLVYNRSNPSEFVKGLKHYFASPRQFLVENAAFHIPVFYQSNFAELTKEVAKIILRVVQQILGEGGNSVDDSILGVYNILRNASHIASSWKLRLLQNRYRDVPAVVVSAGPSLDKNI